MSLPPELVNFVIPFDETKIVERALDSAETLHEFGTISIGYDFMLDTIRIGCPVVHAPGIVTWARSPDLNVGFFLDFVPEADGLRQIAAEACAATVLDLLNRRIDEDLRYDFVRRTHSRIVERLRARDHGRWFARVWIQIGASAALRAGVPRATIVKALDSV